MLVKPCVMLEYKLTTAADNWFTVVMSAKPTAATINAYSTKSCPCSSLSRRNKKFFITVSHIHYREALCCFTSPGAGVAGPSRTFPAKRPNRAQKPVRGCAGLAGRFTETPASASSFKFFSAAG